jgi:ubiquinone/menaquinone biosynthesis C-methylase UbiE
MIAVAQKLKQTYDQQYSNMTAHWRALGARQKAQNILDICETNTYDKVLEVGAGDGSILQILDKQNFANSFFAVEISESGLEEIKAKKIEKLKSTQLFDGYRLPFANKEMDLVVLSHVLEHVEHERVLLREIHRIAKQVVIEVPKDYRYGADKKLAHFLAYGHINLYTPTSLRFLVTAENFSIEKELLRLYSYETFLFGKVGLLAKTKGYTVYFIKKMLSNTPFRYVNSKFINTITLLLKPQ